MLSFPAEAADAHLAGLHIFDPSGAAADAVGVGVVGVFESDDCFVRDRLNQSGAKERDRDAPRDDVGLNGNHRLTFLIRTCKQVVERLAPQNVKLALLIDIARADLGDRADSADGWGGVALRAT